MFNWPFSATRHPAHTGRKSQPLLHNQRHEQSRRSACVPQIYRLKFRWLIVLGVLFPAMYPCFTDPVFIQSLQSHVSLILSYPFLGWLKLFTDKPAYYTCGIQGHRHPRGHILWTVRRVTPDDCRIAVLLQIHYLPTCSILPVRRCSHSRSFLSFPTKRIHVLLVGALV